ncbi:MAG: hypothetical protein ACRDJ5_00870 [Actinomycetota bacterium]
MRALRRKRDSGYTGAPVDETRVTRVPRARGGVSLAAILTGIVVAFGGFLLLGSIVGVVLAGVGIEQADISSAEAARGGLAGGIALVVVLLLSWMWGGYTAGRMGRGAGFAHGFLVPLVALILAALIGAVVAAIAANTELPSWNLPFNLGNPPGDDEQVRQWGTGLGIAALVVMFLGSIIGGALGSRWHTKLERRAEEEIAESHVHDRPVQRDRTVDLREREQQHAATGSTETRPLSSSEKGGATARPRSEG